MAKTDLPRSGIPEDKVPDEPGVESQDLIIERAEEYKGGAGWTISTDSGTGFGMPAAPGIEPPEKGDRVRLWTFNWSHITGMALRGVVVFYQTKEDTVAEAKAEGEKRDAKKKKEYEETGKAKNQAIYEKLPPEFQARLDKYRNGPNKEFGWEYEGYELHACEQAVIYRDRAADAVKDGEPEEVKAFWEAKRIEEGADFEAPPTPELRWLYWWKSLPSGLQRDEMPGISTEMSGNQYEVACVLARLWFTHGEEGVVRLHGALAPLVGSEDYGDPMDEEVAA